MVDTTNGGFFLNLSREGNPLPPYDKHPAMTGRQIYGFSCAYLLSGKEEYLKSARHGVEFLIEYAWDREYCGWYDLLDEKGIPKSTSKTVPNQFYTDVGLAHYYFITGDRGVLGKIMEFNDKPWNKFDPVDRSVSLPEGKNLKMKVTLKPSI